MNYKRNLYILSLLTLFVNCSEYFDFKITGKIPKFNKDGDYSVLVRQTDGQKVKNAKIVVLNEDSVIVTFGALDGIPKTLIITVNGNIISSSDFVFDRNSRSGYISSNSKGQKIEFKKSRNDYGDRCYIAEGFLFQ